jgi:hypothetical protein
VPVSVEHGWAVEVQALGLAGLDYGVQQLGVAHTGREHKRRHPITRRRHIRICSQSNGGSNVLVRLGPGQSAQESETTPGDVVWRAAGVHGPEHGVEITLKQGCLDSPLGSLGSVARKDGQTHLGRCKLGLPPLPALSLPCLQQALAQKLVSTIASHPWRANADAVALEGLDHNRLILLPAIARTAPRSLLLPWHEMIECGLGEPFLPCFRILLKHWRARQATDAAIRRVAPLRSHNRSHAAASL